jgi:hypothetical protein
MISRLITYFKINVPARVIAILWLIMFSSVVPLMFSSDAMNVNKVDVFILIEKLRYPENIAYDLSEWFNITALIYCVYILLPNKKYEGYVKPFLFVSILGLPAYFLFYSQYITLITIPLILIWQIWKIRQHYAKEGDNNRSSHSDRVNG